MAASSVQHMPKEPTLRTSITGLKGTCLVVLAVKCAQKGVPQPNASVGSVAGGVE